MKPKRNYHTTAYSPHPMDSCQTPAYALDPILPYLPSEWVIWESAAGEGLLAQALASHGYRVVTSDILTGQNFFQYDPGAWDCQVTNPPYGEKDRWLGRSYELGKPFALLLPENTLSAESTNSLLEEYGFELIVVNPRIRFKMPRIGFDKSSPQFATWWFTWGLGIGKPISFYRQDSSQLRLFGGG